MLYYLRAKNPKAVRKTVLYSPALPCVLADPFLEGLRRGAHEFLEYKDRQDVKSIFRTFLWVDPHGKKPRKDPFPKLFYEVIYRIYKRDVPEGHYKALQNSLLLGANYHPNSNSNAQDESVYASTIDRDTDCPRLVVWAEDDQICRAEKGQAFFGGNSKNTTFQRLPACGHAFDANGKGVYEVIAPLARDFLLDFESSSSAVSC
jgi:pimeloyl-ACP methyl ester carboxylesterase